MTKKIKAPLPAPPPLTSDQEATEAVRRIGELQRTIERVKADVETTVAELIEVAKKSIAPTEQELQGKLSALQVYCTLHRARLTNNRTKTIDFLTGKVSWRSRPASVSVPKAKDKLAELIARIKTLGFAQFLRTKEEIDKEAMLKEPETAKSIAGVRIKSAGEDFAVEPLAVKIEEPVS
jgi:phage host-nuclease inhibitor protein Gam